jgi:hypothetical protein
MLRSATMLVAGLTALRPTAVHPALGVLCTAGGAAPVLSVCTLGVPASTAAARLSAMQPRTASTEDRTMLFMMLRKCEIGRKCAVMIAAEFLIGKASSCMMQINDVLLPCQRSCAWCRRNAGNAGLPEGPSRACDGLQKEVPKSP